MARKTTHRSTRALEDGRPSSQTSSKLMPGTIASLEATLPPTPLKKLLSADGAGVYVLSTDPQLVDAVTAGGGDQFPVHVVTAFAELRALVEDGRCKIALLDADLVGHGIGNYVRLLRTKEPTLVALIAAPRATAEKLMGLLSDRTVHRLLIKPAAVGITRLLLESAVSRYFQLREEAQNQPLIVPIAAPRRRPSAQRKSSWFAWVLAAGLVSVLIAGIFFGGFVGLEPDVAGAGAGGSAEPRAPAVADGGATPSGEVAGRAEPAAIDFAEAPAQPADVATKPAAEPSESAAAAPDPLADKLARAAAAAEEGRLAEPSGDNALELYADVLAASPDNAAALRGLAAAVDSVFGEAERALLADDFAAAEAAFEHVRRIQPDSNRLRFLETQLRREREAVARREALAAAVPPPAAEPASARDDATESAADADAPTQAANAPPEAANAPTEAANAPPQGADAPTQAANAPTQAPATEPAAAPAAAEPRTEPQAEAVARDGNAAEAANLLAVAWSRLRQNRLLEPAGDSARDYVEQALAVAPGNADAMTLRTELAEAVAESARITLASGDLDGAAALADEAFALGASRETLAMLDLDLAAAREAAAQSAQAGLLASGVARLREDRLIEPENDSALFYLRRLQAENARYPGFESAWSDLGELLAAKARTAVAAGERRDAERWLEPLTLVAGESEAAPLRVELEAQQRQAEYLAEPASAGELRVVTSGQVVYPQEALRRGIEGWVDVEFVVGTDGVPRAAHVVAADPPARFEEAALGSVSLYRYEPFRLDGRVYERLARLRVRFDLE